MVITLNSAACCFQGPFSTSPSPSNLAPGYSSTVESGNSEVLHDLPDVSSPDCSNVLFCRNYLVNC